MPDSSFLFFLFRFDLLNTNMTAMTELLSLLKCVLGSSKASYISVPVTTGERFLSWYELTGKGISEKSRYNDLHEAQVIQENIKEAKNRIEELRGRIHNAVIEPMSLVVQNWSQNDYYEFWTEVINRHIKDAYFFPGWYLSKGCAVEFLYCKQKDIPVYDYEGRELTEAEGIELLTQTIKRYSKLDFETDFFETIIAQLKELCLVS